MKTNLIAHLIRFWCVSALISGLFYSTAAAAPESQNSGANWALEITNGQLRLDESEVEATLGNIINALREIYPANLAVAPGLSRVKVQDLKLSSFRWEQALEALRVASGGAFRWEKKLANPAEESQEDLLILTPDVGAGLPGGRGLEVFNLATYLKNQDDTEIEKSLQEIHSMMLETMEMLDRPGSGADRGEVPQFKFHAGARLFVVVGEGAMLEAARKVLLALPGVTSSQAPYAYSRQVDLAPGSPAPPATQPFVSPYGIGPVEPGGAGGGYGGGFGSPTVKPSRPSKPGLAPSGSQKY